MSDDLELMDQIRLSDTRALGHLHRAHIRSVYWAAYRVLHDHAESDEVAQDVFLTLWNKRTSVVIYGSSALPWLLVTARFLSLNSKKIRVRRYDREVPLGFDVPFERDPLTLLGEAEEAQSLRDAVGGLSADDRKLVALCLGQGLTYKEAAARLGVTHATVRNRLSRVRHQLRTEINRKEGAAS